MSKSQGGASAPLCTLLPRHLVVVVVVVVVVMTMTTTLYQSNLNCLFLPDQAVSRYATLNIT
jgi:hypothetical protein